jgi:lysophospholipase L1-like esterase
MGFTRRRRQSRPHGAGATTLGISAEFPVLKAAYQSGSRALISWIGDSTVANAGGLLEQNSTAYYLREYLAGAGLEGVIGGCFSSGDKGLAGMSIAQYGQFYEPDASFDASFSWYPLEKTAFGLNHAYSTAVGDKVRYDPGMSYDRVELFHATFPGAGAFDLKIGDSAIASIDGNAPVSFTRRAPISVARTSSPIDQIVAGGTAWPGVLRVWDSTAPRKLQVENLGVCSYRCSEWLATSGTMGAGMAAGSQIPLLGAHLVIVQLGVNEMNTGVDAAAYQANLTALIGQFIAAGSDVLVCLPPPALGGYAMDVAHRAAVPAACSATGVGAPVDLHAGIGFDVATDLADLVHPNAAGNHKIVTAAAGVGARILGLG